MFNSRVFANFETTALTGKDDRKFLASLKDVRRSTCARFVNFSVFDYGAGNPDTTHFLTYPMEWVTHYVRHCYTAIDPLLTIDYRKISHVDWREMFVDGRQLKMFDRFAEFGVGNEALSIVCNAGNSVFTALAFFYQCEPHHWPELKQDKMAEFRLQAHSVTDRYAELYRKPRGDVKPLTARELEVLDLAARGNTDEKIAGLMGIGRWTVVDHVQNAKFKLGCANRTAAVAMAITLGLISLKPAM